MTVELQRCCVCGYDMPFDDNDIVACSGCPVVVHQNCYGIKTSTKNGDWYVSQAFSKHARRVGCNSPPPPPYEFLQFPFL